MKLIVETVDTVEVLTEDTGTGKKWYLEGRYMQGGREGVKEDCNKNGRIYTEAVLDKAANKYIADKVNNKTAFGELNHPQSATVNSDRVCIVIESLTKDGLHYNGKARIADKTPTGQIVCGILEAGGRLGVSTRALGTLREVNGIKHVNNDLHFSAIDVVNDPSGQGCMMNHIMESVNYALLEDGTIIQLAVDVTKNKITEAKALKAFSELMIKFGQK